MADDSLRDDGPGGANRYPALKPNNTDHPIALRVTFTDLFEAFDELNGQTM